VIKLQTILSLKENIEYQKQILQQLSQDYLDLIDDDLWTIDLESYPSFNEDLTCVSFNAEKKLTDKYIKRFCEDFGLKLKEEHKTDYGYCYNFEVNINP